MAEQIKEAGSEKATVSRADMEKQLVEDTSNAFLSESRPENIPAKLEAEANWWKSLKTGDGAAPASIQSPYDLKNAQDQGWNYTYNQYYSTLSRTSADGKMRETHGYDNATGNRLDTQFFRADSKEALDANQYKQVVDVGYRKDGTQFNVKVKSGNWDSNFEARFAPDGKMISAREDGSKKDVTEYSFREDGSLYEAVTRSNKDSSVVNDQLFDTKGKPRSDYSPLYLYEKLKRPVENILLGIAETRRGIF